MAFNSSRYFLNGKFIFGKGALIQTSVRNTLRAFSSLPKGPSDKEDGTKIPETSGSDSSSRAPTYQYKPTNWDKRTLVWTKRYAKIEDIPDYVSKDTMDKVKSITRIYINLLMGAFTIISCIAMIISGKRAAKRGESVQKSNLDWHQSNK